jgi:hypothetical protein
MAPVPFHYPYEPAPSTFPGLLRNVWLRLYPHGEDPVYQVFREQLAESVYEYHAEAFMIASSELGCYSRSTKGGTASTPDLAIEFAAMEALTDLRFHEVEMQTHPGYLYYPTLSPTTGRVIFTPVDPACDRATAVLSRYLNASYRTIISLAEELSRVLAALAAVTPVPSPPQTIHPPMHPPPVPPPPRFEAFPTSAVPPGVPFGSRRETPAEWASLLATPAAPMLRRRAPSTPEGEPSQQRRRVSFDPEDEIHIISSDSDSGSDDEESVVWQCSCHQRH